MSVFFYWSGDHRDLHVLTHAFPTRRASVLLHLFAAREHRGGILDDLRVEAVGHLVAEARQREAALVLVGVDLGEDRVEIEIVEMFRTTADLTQQFGAADHLVEALDPEPGEDVADFLGDEGHQDRKSTRLNSSP